MKLLRNSQFMRNLLACFLCISLTWTTYDAVGQEAGQDDVATMREAFRQSKTETNARRLLTKLYIGKRWQSLDDAGRTEFGELLEFIYLASPDDIGVQQLYADYLIAADRLKSALPVLIDLAKSQPMRGLQAAALQRKLGDYAAADFQAEETLDQLMPLFEQDPTNTALALAVAQTQLFLFRYADALQIIDRASKRATETADKDRLNQAMGDAIVAWIAFMQKTEEDQDELQVLKMLKLALKRAPNNPRVLTLLADQILAMRGESTPEVVALRKELTDSAMPGISHFIKGTAALMDDDIEKATEHLKKAAELMPNSSAILNNLAVTMSEKPGGDLNAALELSNTSIKQLGDKATPHFYETRGQILFRMKKYKDAVKDLKLAAEVPSLASAAHKSLAECYKQLGEKDLAAKHRELAK